MKVRLRGLAHYLPELDVNNVELSRVPGGWAPEEILQKTGIEVRRIAPQTTCASDLAFEAATKLLNTGVVQREQIDLLVLCTQSPDYFLPTTACLLQARLGLPKTCAAFDFNLGCSGYIYGLGIVKGMLETEQARCALLLTGETYSKFMRPADLNVRTIFGDGASATLLTADDDSRDEKGVPYAFVYGTDGKGAENLIVKRGALRHPTESSPAVDESLQSEAPRLYMNGPEIFSFTLTAVPPLVRAIARSAQLELSNVDLFVFHQANQFMMEHLRKKLAIPEEKFVVCLKHCGNTVSATIPIALESCVRNNTLHPGMKVMLVGFGVGYSWGGCLINWPENVVTG